MFYFLIFFFFTFSKKPNFILLSDHNENKSFTALNCVIPIHLKVLVLTKFFKGAIVIFSFMYCFWRNTPTILPS